MKEGVKDLKLFLATRGGLPEGVKMRMDQLRWPYNPDLPARPTQPAPFRFRTATPRANRPGPTIGAGR